VSDKHPLDYIFHPRSVAVVGAPTHEGPGSFYVGALKEAGFPGPIYPVNPKATEIQGLTCYPSLRDVPGTVDYVISSVPARVVPQLVEDCGFRGKTVHSSPPASARRVRNGLLEKQAVGRRGFGIRIIG
jgi:acetyltransferase